MVAGAWQVARLSRGGGGPCGSLDTATAIGVEAGAMVGAYCFLVGTAMFARCFEKNFFFFLELQATPRHASCMMARAT